MKVKNKKLTIGQLQKKLWEECRRIVKNRDGNTCFTCGKTNLEGSNYQVGHFIPKGSCGANLKYDLRNLKIQCFHCNINLGGNGAEYYRRMVKLHGQKYVDKLFQDKNKSVKAYDYYLELLEKYKTWT